VAADSAAARELAATAVEETEEGSGSEATEAADSVAATE
jgi:hypothetical protein